MIHKEGKLLKNKLSGWKKNHIVVRMLSHYDSINYFPKYSSKQLHNFIVKFLLHKYWLNSQTNYLQHIYVLYDNKA